ncbi:MAG: hypothetical protein AB7U98_08230 [Candidatus Nitrosocosmicus sp.]|jgi:hypothetical protein
MNWNEVIKKEALGTNDEDFGEVQGFSNRYVLAQKGMINKEKYFILQDKVKSFDGSVLRSGLSEDDLSN